MRTVIQQQVEELLQRYEPEPEHVRQVARLADALFVGLACWHNLGEVEREWLGTASLLHDIGWSQTPSGSGHHKHSARLIRGHSWEGLSPRVVETIALVARYHRRAIPKARHPDYASLPAEDQMLVCKLAGILRVADALDRTHTAVVQGLGVTVQKGEIRVEISANRPCQAELSAVEKKKDLLELVSRRAVVMIVPSTFRGTVG